MDMRSIFVAVGLSIVMLAGVIVPTGLALARDVEDCKARWGSAVRSYLTKNRRAGPSGKVPTNLDEMEEVGMAWIDMFNDACRLEKAGKRRRSRLLAASLGTEALARLDQVACQRFLHYFMKAKDPEGVCQSALEDDRDRIKANLSAALKHQKRLNVPWVSKRRSKR